MIDPGLDLGVAFRHSMGLMAASVSMVTTWVDDRPWGMTITACCSVSANPPTVLVSLATGSVVSRAIAARGTFGVNILSADAIELAKFGAAAGLPKFLDDRNDSLHYEQSGESPSITGALAHLDCELSRAVEVEDHTIYFGRVAAVRFPTDGTPLLYCSREYGQLMSHWGLPHGSAEFDADSRVYPAW